jgi:hypothetical protein
MFQSFVSQDYLKSSTPVLANVDISEIVPFLEETELIQIREIIGKPLYDDVKAKFIAQTLSADEITLVTYIKKALAFRAVSDALPFLMIKITAKGPQTLKGDYSDPVDLNSMKYIRSEINKYSEYHEERLVEYLCKNSQKFPLYAVADNESGIQSTSETRYDSDIFLDDAPLRVNRYLYGPNQNTHNA